MIVDTRSFFGDIVLVDQRCGAGVHTTASEAWQDFRDRSGLEPNGRDADLIKDLSERLGCAPPELDAAVENISADDLVRALFLAVAPFAEMCRDIVLFFKEASAATGRNNWVVALEDAHIDLRDFEQFAQLTPQSASASTCAALDIETAWDLYRVMWPLGRQDTATVPEDVRHWLDAFERGEYHELPMSLMPSQIGATAEEASKIYLAALLEVRRAGLRRDGLARLHEKATRLPPRSSEAFDLSALASLEADNWFKVGILGLAGSLPLAGDHQREALADIDKRLQRFPRRSIAIDADLPLLQRILSLPVWSKRHEVYAVWVATETRRAVKRHPVVLHDENGVLRFEFSEELLATISVESGEVRLIAERRVELDCPIGKGRTGGAQPDYGLWTRRDGKDVCLMVIEVKHYKRSAGRPFAEMYVDYARAHPEASVAMTAHGPAGRALERAAKLDSTAASRCTAYGHMTPANREVREQFRAEVLRRVGPAPVITKIEVLVIDISGSMLSVCSSGVFKSWLSEAKREIASAILVDTDVRWAGASAEIDEALADHAGGGTNLSPALEAILVDFEVARVATDADGAAELARRFGQNAKKTTLPDGLVEVRVTSRGRTNRVG